MCQHPRSVDPVPEETGRTAKAAFPKGAIYMTMRDELGIIFKDEDFAHLFPRRGQPAMAPWRAHDIQNSVAGEKLLNHSEKGRLRFEYATFQANDDPALKLAIYTSA